MAVAARGRGRGRGAAAPSRGRGAARGGRIVNAIVRAGGKEGEASQKQRASMAALKRKMLNAYEHVRNAEDGESSGDDDSEDDGKLNAPDRRERLRAAGLPADAGDDFDEDEEIDEDAAFTAEDEAKYGAMLRGIKRGKGRDDDDDDDDESDEEGIESELAHMLRGSDDDEDDDVEEDDEDEEEDGEDEEDESEEVDDEDDVGSSHNRLMNFVDDLADRPARKRSRRDDVTEALNESEANVSSREKLQLADLLSSASSLQGAASLKHQAALLGRLPGAVSAPQPRRIQERTDRTEAYTHAKEEVGRWDSFVKRHRQSDQLQFPLGVPSRPANVTTQSLATTLRPEGDLELEVAAILEASGYGDQRAAADIELAQLQQLTPIEIEQRQQELSKNRALLFSHELKAKRIAKIKSKDYHRHLKKERVRKEKALLEGMEDGEAMDPARAQKAELDRIQERMSLRHKSTGKWARNASKMASKNSSIRDALSDQHRIASSLTQKNENQDDEEDDGDDDESADKEAASLAAAAAALAAAQRRAKSRAPIVPRSFAVLPDEMTLDPSAAGAPARKGIVLTQSDLVARAFESDMDVLEKDFFDEKSMEVEAGLPVLEDHTVPGWGSWGGQGAAAPRGPSERARREHAEARKQAADKRADAKLKHVIINEKRNTKVEAKYAVKKVPFPYQSKAQYERSLDMPAGKDWNTVETFQKATKPRVLSKAGTIIAPPTKPTQ